MRISYKVWLVGGIPIFIAAAVAVLAWMLLKEAERAGDGAVSAGTIYRNLLVAMTARDNYVQSLPGERASYAVQFGSLAERTRGDLTTLETLTREETHRSAAASARDALAHYERRMRQFMVITTNNDHLAAEMRDRHGFVPAEISPGGGMAISYTPGDQERQPAPDRIAAIIGGALRDCAAAVGLPAPRTWIEPGRALVGQAGVALYTVGTVKEIPGVRRYVATDGGMADNIRPALYGAEYTAAIANRPGPHFHVAPTPAAEGALSTRLVGKYCESGDMLIREIDLPDVQTGELLALPASGAYNLAMSSNYNLAFRPAVVFVNDGRARLTRRRETLDDLLGAEVFES